MVDIKTMTIDELRSLRSEVNQRIKEEKYGKPLICGVTKFDRDETSRLRPYRLSVKRKDSRSKGKSRWISIVADTNESEIMPYLETVITDLQEMARKIRNHELL